MTKPSISSNKNDLIDAAYVKTLLHYDPETGVFTWLKKRSNFQRGGVAGTVDQLGYRFIMINRRRYLAHRLAWLYCTGRWPEAELDHINGSPLDNRLANLRPATRSENGQNTPLSKRNTSGFRGVSFISSISKWRAAIRANGEYIHIGNYDNPLSAHRAYERMANKLHGEFRRKNSHDIFA